MSVKEYIKPKTFSLIVIFFVAIMITFGLIRQINGALEASSRLDEAADQVANLREQNQNLKSELDEVQGYDYIERVARDKLNFSRPNETVVIIKEEALEKILGAEKGVEEIKIPNWQGWLRLFGMN